jgi:hypothetical protein
MSEQNRTKILKVPNPKAKKTRKKLVSQWINGSLMALDSPLKSYYQRAFFCSHRLYQKGQSVSSKYCNCRTCIICNAIRTAHYLNHYGSQVLDFNDAQFLTLTAPTVQCYDSDTLRHFIDAREFVWRKICENARVGQKGKIFLKGIRAMEITSRPDDRYHIHFHFIIEGKNNAEWVKEKWLKHYKEAEPYLQVIKPLTTKKGLLEVFKYGTKFINKKKLEINGKMVDYYEKVEPEKTDLIIRSLRNKHLISTFGGIRGLKNDDVNEIVEETPIEDLKDIEYLIWDWQRDSDWFDTMNGEKFSDFIASDGFKKVFLTDK